MYGQTCTIEHIPNRRHCELGYWMRSIIIISIIYAIYSHDTKFVRHRTSLYSFKAFLELNLLSLIFLSFLLTHRASGSPSRFLYEPSKIDKELVKFFFFICCGVFVTLDISFIFHLRNIIFLYIF